MKNRMLLRNAELVAEEEPLPEGIETRSSRTHKHLTRTV